MDFIRRFHHNVYISAKEEKKTAIRLIHILGRGLPRQGQLHLEVVTELDPNGTVGGPEDEVSGWVWGGGEGNPCSRSGEYPFIACVSLMVHAEEINISKDQEVGN